MDPLTARIGAFYWPLSASAFRTLRILYPLPRLAPTRLPE